MKNLWTIIKITSWTAFLISFGLIYYINHYLPHGPVYPTGEYTCLNDDRGPCRETYIEEMRGLDIPNWAKFMRRYDLLLLIALGMTGMIGTIKTKELKEKT